MTPRCLCSWEEGARELPRAEEGRAGEVLAEEEHHQQHHRSDPGALRKSPPIHKGGAIVFNYSDNLVIVIS